MGDVGEDIDLDNLIGALDAALNPGANPNVIVPRQHRKRKIRPYGPQNHGPYTNIGPNGAELKGIGNLFKKGELYPRDEIKENREVYPKRSLTRPVLSGRLWTKQGIDHNTRLPSSKNNPISARINEHIVSNLDDARHLSNDDVNKSYGFLHHERNEISHLRPLISYDEKNHDDKKCIYGSYKDGDRYRCIKNPNHQQNLYRSNKNFNRAHRKISNQGGAAVGENKSSHYGKLNITKHKLTTYYKKRS